MGIKLGWRRVNACLDGSKRVMRFLQTNAFDRQSTKTKTMSSGFQRGPRLGDAKSLWNFSSSRGWTKDEIRTLQLCLMKYGVGQWTAILNTGLLPGKVVGQLNSQTQRLLGQQSLAVFSGLRIDVEKIRKDNAAKTKVTRKGGVIINTGSKLSIEEIEEMKSEISRKYALTNHQQIEVDQKLNKLQNMKLKCNNNLQIVQNLSSLLDCDTKGLNRQARIEHLGKLREELKALESQYDNQIALSSASSLKNMEPHDCLKISTDTDGENPTQTRSSSGSSRSKRSKRPRTNAKYIIPENNPISVDEPLDSSIEAIMNLGYSRRHAIDALFETENNLEAAIDWLLLNCN